MIREKILQVMKDKSIKAADISEATNFDKSSLSLYLNGKREIRIQSIEKILIYLELEISSKSK